MTIEEVTQKITPVLKAYNVEYASVFGSVSRGEDMPKSDVDLLIKVGKLPRGIWGFIGLKQDLEQALDKKVDLISEAALTPKLSAKINKDLVKVYAR